MMKKMTESRSLRYYAQYEFVLKMKYYWIEQTNNTGKVINKFLIWNIFLRFKRI